MITHDFDTSRDGWPCKHCPRTYADEMIYGVTSCTRAQAMTPAKPAQKPATDDHEGLYRAIRRAG